jgi:glycine dehydrogenase subunit 1
MPFIPHTQTDIDLMLETIGISGIEDVFDEIPANILTRKLDNIPAGIPENALMGVMRERAARDVCRLNFLGAGAYEHHIPAAVWDIASRGEFMTAYTPYQAEASQGTLQLLYEYQTMMANLTGMAVSNASLYDGASALAEAVLMAVRLKKDAHPKIVLPRTLHPGYVKTLSTILHMHDIEIITLEFDTQGLIILPPNLSSFTAMIIPQLNFLGLIEAVDALTDFAHQHQALAIGVVNPLSLGLLKEPGRWGQSGADIVCGEAQPLGIPLASGGPYCGFITCKKEFVRQVPGRIAGATVDKEGKRGFTLTLQAREQHIRRGKATSNICTNQGLLVTAVTIYLSLLGFEGLKNTASHCHANATFLFEKLTALPHIKPVFSTPFFHEIVVQFEKPVETVLAELSKEGILGGYPLEKDYSDLKNCLLICTTETKTKEDLENYVYLLEKFS